MPVSNSFDFNLTVDEVIRQASQDVGGGRLDAEEYRFALRKLNMVLRDILNRGIPLALIRKDSLTLSETVSQYTLDEDIIDVHDAVIKNTSTNTELGIRRYSYAEFNRIPKKSQTGRPTVFMTQRDYDRVRLNVWPVPNNSNFTLEMYVFTKPDDVERYTDNLKVQPRYLSAVIAGLAVELAKSRRIDLDWLTVLAADYESKLEMAQSEDRERVSYRIRPQLQTRL